MKILKKKKHVNGFTLILVVIFFSVFAGLVVSMATANVESVDNEYDARMALSAAKFGLQMANYFVTGCDAQAKSANLEIKNSEIHAAWKSMCDSIIANPVAVVPDNNDIRFKDDVATGKELILAPFKYGSRGVTFTLRFYKYNQVIDPNVSFTVESTGAIGDISRTVAIDFKVTRNDEGSESEASVGGSIKNSPSKKQLMTAGVKAKIVILPVQGTYRECSKIITKVKG